MNRRSMVFAGLALPLAPGIAVSAESAPQAREPTADEAKVVVFRGRGGPGSWRAWFVDFNGIPAVKLNDAQHTWIFLKPGDYDVSVRLPWDLQWKSNGQPSQMTFEGGKTYYFGMDSALGGGRMSFGANLVSKSYADSIMRPPGPKAWHSKHRALEPRYVELGATDR